MNRTSKVALFVAVIVLVALAFSRQGLTEMRQARPDYEVLFTIPIGDAGLHYSGIGPESRPWGPSSFRIASDGTFWIADTAAHRLVQFDESGTLLSVLEMPESVVGITDFGMDARTFIVLDASAVEPAVYRISEAGVVLDRWTLLSGIETPTGVRVKGADLFLEQEGGAIVSRLADNGAGALEKTAEANGLNISTLDKVFSLRTSQKQRNERVRDTLARVAVLDFQSEHIIPILVEEMVSLPILQVDQTVWLYDESLRSIGRARVPLAQQYVYVEHPVVVGPTGEVYALLTAPEHVSVVRLNIHKELRPVLPTAPRQTGRDYLGTFEKACLARDTMLATASFYLNNIKSLTATNISGSCSGRGKPRYLSSAGSYYSVPYDWGGNDTVAGFNSAMDASTNNKAGDIDTAASETCSRGVDCSGYVGRIWGKSVKYNTDTLRNISARLSSTAVLKQGDVMNKVSDHVALFVRTSSSGAYWYESTKFNSYDRVIYVYHPWSYFSLYEPRRFLDVCGGQSE